MSVRLVCRSCGLAIVEKDGEWEHVLPGHDHDEEIIASKQLLPIHGARLNEKYALVRLTYLQAKMLYLAADQMSDDAAEDALKNIGWNGRERLAFQQAMANLGQTAERWPS